MAIRKSNTVRAGADIIGTLRGNLGFLRTIRRYSMGEFGTVCGVSQPTMRKMIRDPRSITLGQLLAIADLADMDPCKLLTYDYNGGE